MTVALEQPQAAESSCIGVGAELAEKQNLRKLALAAMGAAALKTVLGYPMSGALALFIGTGAIAYPQLKKIKRGKWGLHLFTIAGMGFFTASMLSVAVMPAQAAFFNNAEQAFTSAFPLSSAAVTTIFTIIRALYVAYLVYSAINIWTAFDRNEDWMSVAKAPVIAFAGGELTDAVANVIVT